MMQRATAVSFALALALALGVGLAGCEPSCPQQPSACPTFSKIRLTNDDKLLASRELAAYRITIRYSTKEGGGGSAQTTGSSGAGGEAATTNGGAAGSAIDPTAGGAGDSGSDSSELDGFQTCIFTTPFEPFRVFQCEASGPFVFTTEANVSSSCGLAPGDDIELRCSSSATLSRVLVSTRTLTRVRVSLEKNAQAFPAVDVAFAGKTVQPDGPSCSSTCVQNEAALSLDALMGADASPP
jgi:hypothetical protein